MLIIIVF